MGGFNPASPHPWNSRGECDCSGFVAWCLGVSRHTDNPWYVKQNGGWVETSAIVRDATSPFGFFDAIPWELSRPGDILVYGDRRKLGILRQGHVGIIASTTGTLPATAIHCSKGNATKGDAIAETGVTIWEANDGIAVKCAFVEG